MKAANEHRPLPTAKRPRPQTVGDARNDIQRIYLANRWDQDEQLRFHQIVGVEPKPVKELSKADLAKVLERMERARMIIYQDK